MAKEYIGDFNSNDWDWFFLKELGKLDREKSSFLWSLDIIPSSKSFLDYDTTIKIEGDKYISEKRYRICDQIKN